VEIRGDQINANELVMRNLGVSDKVSYVEGDSVNLSSLLKGEYFDMCLTCPPYYNLEIYSKKDLSAMGTYAEFIENYSKILKDACLLLKNNSFFVIVVGDLRNDEGAYYGFVYDTIRILLDSKLKLYNEIILKNSIGTAAVRAANSMKTKKITKIHQNVLVFYKGDIKKIDKTPVDLSDI